MGFAGGTAIFLLGSALSGASQTMDQFIAFRALQGLGAGIGIALAFVLVADMFPPAERAKWQSLFGVVYGFSSLVGPTLGAGSPIIAPLSARWSPRPRAGAGSFTSMYRWGSLCWRRS